MPSETNYLEAVAGVQPRPPVSPLSRSASPLPIEDNPPGPLQYPGAPRHGIGEIISPEFLAELHRYIEQTVSATVTEGIKTLIPEVIELTLAQTRAPSTGQERAQASVALSSRPVGNLLSPRYDETPVPTLHQRRPIEGRQDFIAWLSMLGIVASLAGTIVISVTYSPQASTERVVSGQNSQIQQQNQVIQELTREASRPKNCRAFCF